MDDLISRRSFFRRAFAVSAVSLVAGCSKSSSSVPDLVALYSTNRVIAAGVAQQRLPFAVVEEFTNYISDNSELAVNVKSGGKIIDQLTVKAHIVDHDHVGISETEPHEHSEIGRYFPLRVNFESPGIYDLEVTFPNGVASIPVQAFSEAEVSGIIPGDSFPILETPIDGSGEATENPLDVDKICSRVENCGLHSKSASQLIGKKPVAILVATPAFCSTAYCGPVLETMLALKDEFTNVEMIHLEVYANAEEVGGDYSNPNIKFAQHMKTLDLEYEPALYLVGSNGILADRLDNIVDQNEFRAALQGLV